MERGELFCEACRCEVGVKESLVKQHISSKRHVKGKKRRQSESVRQISVYEAMKAYEQRVHPKGETLPQSEKVWRINVVTPFLRAGVPLLKIDPLRTLLEMHAPRLASSRHLSDLIPFIQEQERASLKKDLAGHDVSVIFDGCTRLGEALVIIVRFVDFNENSGSISSSSA